MKRIEDHNEDGIKQSVLKMKRIEDETSRWNQSKAYRRLSVSRLKRLEDQDRIKAKRIEDGASKMKQIKKSNCVSIHRSVIEDGIKVKRIEDEAY